MLVKCEDVFRFKKHSNRRGRGLKLADIPNAVNNVSCKPGYAFCDNKVDLPGLAVMEHSNKAVAMLQRRTGNTLICINTETGFVKRNTRKKNTLKRSIPMKKGSLQVEMTLRM